MKYSLVGSLLLAITLGASQLHAEEPVVGGEMLSHTVIDSAVVATGWSAKKLIGAHVVNSAGDKVGKVHDIIITKDGEGGTDAGILIVDVGGFLGMGEKHIALPSSSFQSQKEGSELLLPEATKDTLKELPAFTYAR